MIINCREIAKTWEEADAEAVRANNLRPHLAIITTDEADNASQVYMRNKRKAIERIGGDFTSYSFSTMNAETEDIIEAIRGLNADKNIHGIIVQLPLPSKFNVFAIQNAIAPEKDVDGFRDNSIFSPATPAGVMELLMNLRYNLCGTHCVVIGRSKIVGAPLSQMLLRENATVSQCHSHTTPEQLAILCRNADFIFCAAGVQNLIKPEYLTPGRTVAIDISINRREDGKLCGDLDPACYPLLKDYTPVPGGIGPITVATLMNHLTFAALNQRGPNDER